MAKRRLRVTGFTRFFLFMLIVIPAAYFGVTYYKGEDGLQMLKEKLNLEQKTENVADANFSTDPSNCATLAEENADLAKRLLEKSEQVTTLYKEIDELRSEIQTLKEPASDE